MQIPDSVNLTLPSHWLTLRWDLDFFFVGLRDEFHQAAPSGGRFPHEPDLQDQVPWRAIQH